VQLKNSGDQSDWIGSTLTKGRWPRMKKEIKLKMEQARARAAGLDLPSGKPTKLSVLVSSGQADTSVREISDGESLTIRDVQARLRCEKDKALRMFKKEPGVVKIGKSYLIPRSVFERVLRRSLIAA